MDANPRLTVTMELRQWDITLRVLADGPYRMVGPVIGEMQRQLQGQIRQQDPALPQPQGLPDAAQPGNGMDHTP